MLTAIEKIAKGIKDSVLKQHAEMQRSISAAEEDLDKWVQVANANVLHDVRRGLGDVSQIMALQLAIAEDNLNSTFRMLTNRLWMLLLTRTEYQRQKILQWLSTISYTSQHSLASRNLLENSGLWLLNHKQFVDWEDSPDSSVFWLHGSSKLVLDAKIQQLHLLTNLEQAERARQVSCKSSEEGGTVLPDCSRR